MARIGRSGLFLVFFVFALAVVVGGPAAWRSIAGAQILRDAPELEPNLGWLNTDRPLRLSDELKGHVVLLDFWTYCCINCLHVIPDLKYLEAKYADEPFVVIGVHSAKFTAEGERDRIRNAMFRYGIEHPVVVDDSFAIWRKYRARAWPTFVLIGADGKIIGQTAGEGRRELLDEAIGRALEFARENGTLAERRVEFDLDAQVRPATGLNYPGKVRVLRAHGDRQAMLAIADSANHRVVLTTYPDAEGRSSVLRVIGGKDAGFADGFAEDTRFNKPEGMAYDAEGGRLFIADRGNHAVRMIDMATFSVGTLVGTGEQSYDRVGGGSGREQALSSPWDLELSPDGGTLYIAMAGPHQIWATDLESLETRAIAGSGIENSFDAPAPEAALAQPSGLAISRDGRRLYFADSESSGIRVVDFGSDPAEVRTIVGYRTPSLRENGLFYFGDVDGVYPEAQLQHPLCLTLIDTPEGELLLIADSYNDKIKLIDPAQQRSTTWAGGGDGPASLRLYEPAGVDFNPADSRLFVADTNNHRVLMLDAGEPGEVRERAWREVMIAGLSQDADAEPEGAVHVSAAVDVGRSISIEIRADLPEGAKISPEFPASVRVRTRSEGDEYKVVAQRTVTRPTLPLEVEVPEGFGAETLIVEASMAYCFDDESVCLPLELAWVVTLEPGPGRSAVLTGAPGER